MTKPVMGDFAPYYEPYIAMVPNKAIVDVLQEQAGEVPTFFTSIPPDKESYRYAEGKWSVKQILGHLIDTERVMSYRAMRIARGDTTELPGFDENLYVRNGHFDDRTMYNLIEEFQVVRGATIFLAQSVLEEDINRRGTANNKEVTVNALFHIIAGHAMHHQKIIKERYLV